MMYLVSTLAAGAAAVELRGLGVNHTDNKIEFNGHGFADGQIVGASAALATNVKTSADNTGDLYIVDGATTNDFQLKGMDADLKATGSAIVLTTTADGSAATTISAFGAKKCQVSDAKATGDKVTCKETPTFALTDKLVVYCPTSECKLDAAGGGNTATDQLSVVYADTANSKEFKLLPAKDGTAITIGTDMDTNSKNKVWLLSVDSASIYATAPKTLIADGGKWDTANDTGVCGNAACGLANGTLYHYTAGSVATAGLTTDTVYNAAVNGNTPYKFQLNAANATVTGAKDSVAIAVTSSGNGDSYQKITDARKITGSTTTANTITIDGDNTAGNAKYAADTVMIFYCSDKTTAADCDYKVTGMTSGSTWKVKAVTNGTGPAHTAATLKAATGTNTDAIVVTETTTGKTKGFALVKDSSDAVIFPAAAAGGSAARSFAMLGSAVAMATAFLLA